MDMYFHSPTTTLDYKLFIIMFLHFYFKINICSLSTNNPGLKLNTNEHYKRTFRIKILHMVQRTALEKRYIFFPTSTDEGYE